MKERKTRGGPTIKDLIKQHWAETGGVVARLHEKFEEIGRPISKSHINHERWALLKRDGWKPPTAGRAPAPEAKTRRGGIRKSIEARIKDLKAEIEGLTGDLEVLLRAREILRG